MKSMIRNDIEYFQGYVKFLQQHWDKQVYLTKEEIDNLIPAQLDKIENALYQLDSERIKVPEEWKTPMWSIKVDGRLFRGTGRIEEVILEENKFSARLTGDIDLNNITDKEYPEEKNINYNVTSDDYNTNLTVELTNELIQHNTDDTGFDEIDLEQNHNTHEIDNYLSSTNDEESNDWNEVDDYINQSYDTSNISNYTNKSLSNQEESDDTYDNENIDEENTGLKNYNVHYISKDDGTWSGNDSSEDESNTHSENSLSNDKKISSAASDKSYNSYYSEESYGNFFKQLYNRYKRRHSNDDDEVDSTEERYLLSSDEEEHMEKSEICDRSEQGSPVKRAKME